MIVLISIELILISFHGIFLSGYFLKPNSKPTIFFSLFRIKSILFFLNKILKHLI